MPSLHPAMFSSPCSLLDGWSRGLFHPHVGHVCSASAIAQNSKQAKDRVNSESQLLGMVLKTFR